jgi:hypothetical protein
MLVVLVVCGLCRDAAAQAQAPAADWRNPEARRAYIERARQRADTARRVALDLARARGWPARNMGAGRAFELRLLDAGRPVYVTTHNVNAAISTAVDLVRNTLPYDVNGAGLTVGIWDAGSARATHREFQGRSTASDGAAAHFHSTHVGGTIAAAGIDANALGMAPGVHVISYDWNFDTTEMAAAAAAGPAQPGEIYISNHSYGFITGWEPGAYSGTAGPHYFGVFGEREDRGFGQYGDVAAEWDDLCYNAPYFVPFVAAGNDRNDIAPAPGTAFFYFNNGWQSKAYDPDTDPLGDGWDNGGYDTMSTIASGKNSIAVGAVHDAVSGSSRSLGNAVMSDFSGWGPADDGRVKPDLVANGIGLYSTDSDNDSDYVSLSGTSMATPNAAGSALLLQEYYADLFPGEAMRGSTLKGLLIHTADDLGNAGPDYRFGWGLINAKAGLDQIKAHRDAPDAHCLVEGVLQTGAPTTSFTFLADGGTPIRVTLCWTDPPGSVKTGLDDRSAVLMNDLDLRLTRNADGAVMLPYILDVLNPAAPATTGDNSVDTVEQVLLAAPAAGLYTLTVSAPDGLTTAEQRFSIILSGQVVDPLRVTPNTDVVATGFQGGPFTPAGATFTLTNLGSDPASWTAMDDAPWLDVSPAGGGLAGGATASVAVALNASANTLPGGHYVATITFHNSATGATQNRRLHLTVRGIATLPFTETFESGALETHWEVSGTGTFRTRVTDNNGPHAGAYHLTMDTSASSSPSRNELTLRINLLGKENVVLSFWAREFNDEAHGPPASPFTTGADFDGVAVSADGLTWHEVHGLRNLSGSYTQRTIDLDAAIAAHDLSYTGAFLIRFNQYDNLPIPTDGIALDDITITGTQVNQPPTISAIGNQTTAESTPIGPLDFTVDDAETPADALTVTATSSNTGLLPNANLLLGGSGAARTILLTPLSGSTGDTTITITVTDANGAAAGTSFLLSVTPPPDTDGDGMPDAYELAHGLDPGDANDAESDIDGDGFDSFAEFRAGTDPNDPASAIAIIDIAAVGLDIIVTFSSIAGRSYRVLANTVFPTGTWTPIADNVPGTGGPIGVSHPGAATTARAAYQVEVVP